MDAQVGDAIAACPGLWGGYNWQASAHSPETNASGLVFVGDVDRCYRAYDVATGDVLWETRLGHAGHGYPITYAVDGKQYIALPAGLGIFRSATATLSPEIYSPESGNALYVFALPD